jgi:ABC-2 type transport system permease protein
MWRRVFHIFWRDFASYFWSPAAYVTIFAFLFLNGLILNFELGPARANGDVDVALRYLFGNFFFWILMLTVPPLVAMRLLAEERRSGTVELLMTAPVRTAEVIAGKYAAGFLFTAFIWSLLLVDLGLLAARVSLDWGTIGAVYVGILGVEAFFVATGLFASALSRNQIVAAVLGLGMNLLVFFLGLYHQLFRADQYEALIWSYLSVISHFVRDFAAGVVDFRYLGLYVIFTAVGLVAAAWTFEARKWR